MPLINPWASQQFKDYKKLRDEFGIEEFNFTLPDAPPIFRRGIIFGHRDFQLIYDRIINSKPFAVLTGLMPSGRMHFGHKMTIDQVVYYQNQGGDVHIAVADIEAYASRGISLEKAEKIALEEYIPSYIALGISPDKAEVYFQSKRREVKDLAWKLAKKINMNEFLKIYGFDKEANMTHLFAPLIQVGDILHVQLDRFGGRRPTVVPVGVDQDPHMRLTRDLVERWRMFSVVLQEGKIGVFYRGESPEKVLNEVASIVGDLGFDVHLNIPYKALYASGTNWEHLRRINEAIIEYERKINEHGFFPPSATYHRLITGLNGGKMSSSIPDSAIFLTDSPEEAVRKVKRAITGGGATLEEHRKYGGNPDRCSIYEFFAYHLIEDDSYLKEIYESCKSGERICGKCKKEAANLVEEWMKDFHERRENAKDMVKEIVRYD